VRELETAHVTPGPPIGAARRNMRTVCVVGDNRKIVGRARLRDKNVSEIGRAHV